MSNRLREIILGAAVSGAAWLCVSSADATGMRCENRLVRPGDSAYDVRALCGAPDDVQQRTERRRVRQAVKQPCPGGGRALCTVIVDEEADVVIEHWTYDFGPRRFIQLLTFEQGKLIEVKSGGYGHKQE